MHARDVMTQSRALQLIVAYDIHFVNEVGGEWAWLVTDHSHNINLKSGRPHHFVAKKA